MNFIISLLGLVLLSSGANHIVASSLAFASRYSLNSIIVGLTLVAFGTSAPELAVTISSNYKQVTDIAFSGIFGSSIFNNLLVLGLVFFFTPIKVNKRLIIRELPFGVVSVLMLFVLLNDKLFANASENILSIGDGLSLLLLFSVFVWILATYKEGFFEHHQDAPQYSLSKTIYLFFLGLFFISIGSHLLIDSVVAISDSLSVSFKFLGVTLVAFATSAPELATAYYAIKSKHTNLVFGNVIGSNIFNILFILGLSSVLSPMKYNSSLLNTDLIIVIIAKVLLISSVVFAPKKHTLQRVHGVLFLSLFVLYMIYLFTQI